MIYAMLARRRAGVYQTAGVNVWRFLLMFCSVDICVWYTFWYTPLSRGELSRGGQRAHRTYRTRRGFNTSARYGFICVLTARCC